MHASPALGSVHRPSELAFARIPGYLDRRPVRSKKCRCFHWTDRSAPQQSPCCSGTLNVRCPHLCFALAGALGVLCANMRSSRND